MKYFDRKGVEVSRDKWRDLFRTFGYGDVERTQQGDVVVDTSWVGMVFDRERIPKTFLTRTYTGSYLSGDFTSTHPDIWSETEAAAIAAHRTARDAVRI